MLNVGSRGREVYAIDMRVDRIGIELVDSKSSVRPMNGNTEKNFLRARKCCRKCVTEGGTITGSDDQRAGGKLRTQSQVCY